MENVTLNDILKISGGIYYGDKELLKQKVTDIARDNRQCIPGSLFVAFKGEKTDGHNFISGAKAQGAIAVMGEDAEAHNGDLPYIHVKDNILALGKVAKWYRKRFSCVLIGVSGSVGKTTCKEMLSTVLAQKFHTLTTQKNLNHALGVPLTLFQLNSAHQIAVIEMGISDFGEMDYLADIVRPDFAVLTNCGDAHLEKLGDRAGVLRAKTEMIRHLPLHGTAFVNGDDEQLRSYQPPTPRKRVLFGLNEGNHIRATELVSDENGVSCNIDGYSFYTSATGEHLIYSILPSYALGKQLGMSNEEIAAGISAFSPLSGRGNIISAPRCTIIDHSYNANPSSTRAALAALSSRSGRKVAILGDMYELGNNSAELHYNIGKSAASSTDLLICVGNLGADIHRGAMDAECSSYYFADLSELKTQLPQLIKQGDQVLIKASHSMHLDELVADLTTLDAK